MGRRVVLSKEVTSELRLSDLKELSCSGLRVRETMEELREVRVKARGNCLRLCSVCICSQALAAPSPTLILGGCGHPQSPHP